MVRAGGMQQIQESHENIIWQMAIELPFDCIRMMSADDTIMTIPEPWKRSLYHSDGVFKIPV